MYIKDIGYQYCASYYTMMCDFGTLGNYMMCYCRTLGNRGYGYPTIKLCIANNRCKYCISWIVPMIISIFHANIENREYIGHQYCVSHLVMHRFCN